MNRRNFLLGSAGFLATSVICRKAFGQGAPPGVAVDPANASVAGQLSIALDSPSHLVPENFTGLSYELAQLTDPGFFAAGNRELVALFCLLSPHGVLRVGGNSSESCWLKVESTTTAPELPPVSGPVSEHWMPRQLFMIPPEAIDGLAGFLRATGWQLIYGLNFGHSSPDRLAREAEFVANRVHDSLLYFQIGNEPDLYSSPTNRTRPAGWGFDDYLREWTACADAISRRVPDAKFGGPDVARSSKWITQFIPAAAARLGPRLVAASGHYYAEGPPDDPRVTTERLLRTNPEIGASAKRLADLASRNGLVYRLTEGNSCYRGGKPGMSDALASALWGGDYMLSLAEAGCAGVNLHGGGALQPHAGRAGRQSGRRQQGRILHADCRGSRPGLQCPAAVLWNVACEPICRNPDEGGGSLRWRNRCDGLRRPGPGRLAGRHFQQGCIPDARIGNRSPASMPRRQGLAARRAKPRRNHGGFAGRRRSRAGPHVVSPGR
jgi:hypothetical protein